MQSGSERKGEQNVEAENLFRQAMQNLNKDDWENADYYASLANLEKEWDKLEEFQREAALSYKEGLRLLEAAAQKGHKEALIYIQAKKFFANGEYLKGKAQLEQLRRHDYKLFKNEPDQFQGHHFALKWIDYYNIKMAQNDVRPILGAKEILNKLLMLRASKTEEDQKQIDVIQKRLDSSNDVRLLTNIGIAITTSKSPQAYPNDPYLAYEFFNRAANKGGEFAKYILFCTERRILRTQAISEGKEPPSRDTPAALMIYENYLRKSGSIAQSISAKLASDATVKEHLLKTAALDKKQIL